MSRGDLGVAGIPADARQHPDTECCQHRGDVPQLAGDVVLADQVHIVGGGERRFDRADHVFQQGRTGEAVAEVLAAGESGRVHRDDRHLGHGRRRRAHRVDVVADHRRDAGGVHEDRGWMVASGGLDDGVVETLFPAEHHLLFTDVGGEAAPVQCRTGREAAPTVPRVAGTSDRPVHHVGDIGDGHQRDHRTVERTAAGGTARLGFRASRLSRREVLGAVVIACRLVEQRDCRERAAGQGSHLHLSE